MYGKLIDGNLEIAPNIIIDGDKTIYNPSAERLIKLGYKEVIETPYPEIDPDNPKYYVSHYEEKVDKIIKVWEESEPPEPEPPTPTVEDRVVELETKQVEQESLNKDVTDALVELAEMIVGG